MLTGETNSADIRVLEMTDKIAACDLRARVCHSREAASYTEAITAPGDV